MNSIVLTEKLWAAEGAIAGKFIVYTAFGINFYCLSLIFHNKYYKRYIFPSRYLAVVPMVIEKLLLKVITPQNYFSSAPWASHNFLGIQDGRRIGKKVYYIVQGFITIATATYLNLSSIKCLAYQQLRRSLASHVLMPQQTIRNIKGVSSLTRRKRTQTQTIWCSKRCFTCQD